MSLLWLVLLLWLWFERPHAVGMAKKKKSQKLEDDREASRTMIQDTCVYSL